MVVFVLVHGTGHDGWCWRFLVPLLREVGYDVYTPTLTGLGASSHLAHELNRISLGTHVKDIANMLFYEDLSDVVLVGHSYGGMVITGVAAKESKRLAHLVYLDAYLPFEGENEVALWPPVQREVSLRYCFWHQVSLTTRVVCSRNKRPQNVQMGPRKVNISSI